MQTAGTLNGIFRVFIELERSGRKLNSLQTVINTFTSKFTATSYCVRIRNMESIPVFMQLLFPKCSLTETSNLIADHCSLRKRIKTVLPEISILKCGNDILQSSARSNCMLVLKKVLWSLVTRRYPCSPIESQAWKVLGSMFTSLSFYVFSSVSQWGTGEF